MGSYIEESAYCPRSRFIVYCLFSRIFDERHLRQLQRENNVPAVHRSDEACRLLVGERLVKKVKILTDCVKMNFNTVEIPIRWISSAIYIKLCWSVGIRSVVFRLFPKTVNLPQKPVGYRLTFIQYFDIIFYWTCSFTPEFNHQCACVLVI